MPADTTAPTWLIDFRARQPTPWRSNYGGPGREVVSVREGSAIGPAMDRQHSPGRMTQGGSGCPTVPSLRLCIELPS